MRAPGTLHRMWITMCLAVLLGLVPSLGAVVTLAGGHPSDPDRDLVPDGFDDCRTTADGPWDPCDQQDTDMDGYGNACDSDFNNNGIVDINDFNLLASAFGKAVGDPGYPAQADANCNDVIDISDFNALASGFGQPPGPSSLGCAGAIPCP